MSKHDVQQYFYPADTRRLEMPVLGFLKTLRTGKSDAFKTSG